MSYENHIGEFLKAKLTKGGRTQAWLAKEMKTSRQNISNTWISKTEYKPSEINELEKVLGKDFFTEFFQVNKIPGTRFAQVSQSFKENKIPIPTGSSDFGFKLKIEIDPYQFNAEHAHILGDCLKRALEEFKKSIEEDL
jgi:transcriptional regulator with XRE-family HTH domain